MNLTRSEKGLTLVELLLAITILGIIAGATMPLLSTSLKAHTTASAKSSLHHEGLLAMERMTNGLRKTTYVAVPNGQSPTRDILAFSRLVNTDNDFYFGDPLFPSIDEDTDSFFSKANHGIKGVDDDGDGNIDEGADSDDDEDGVIDEDWLDGLDNDGDGTIDEEVLEDSNNNGASGILGVDDNGDGLIDDKNETDDDEDLVKNEEEILFFVYRYNAPTKTLTEIHSDAAEGINNPAPQIILSSHVTDFTTTYYPPDATNAPRISISLTLTGDDGNSITFLEYVYPRNILQKTGKRVR